MSQTTQTMKQPAKKPKPVVIAPSPHPPVKIYAKCGHLGKRADRTCGSWDCYLQYGE